MLKTAIRSTLILCSLALASGAAGQEGSYVEVQMSTGVVCDTAEQVERYVELVDEGRPEPTALTEVNEEYDTPEAQTWVCAALSVAYVKGRLVKSLDARYGQVDIHAILVVGFRGKDGWHPLQPEPQFAPFLAVKGVDA